MNTPAPGIYADIPNETSHSWPRASTPMLDQNRTAPATPQTSPYPDPAPSTSCAPPARARGGGRG